MAGRCNILDIISGVPLRSLRDRSNLNSYPVNLHGIPESIGLRPYLAWQKRGYLIDRSQIRKTI